jgi:NADH:ubiquinone oxidoreductase subunit 3 (subunit A)
LLLLVNAQPPLVRYSLYGTVFIVFSLAVTLICGMALELSETPFFRFLGVLAILDALGTIATPLLRRLIERPVPRDSKGSSE